MSDWTNGDYGPKCFCGKDTIVTHMGDKPALMCFGHTRAEAATFALPQQKPEGWDTMTRDEQIKIVQAAYVPDEDDDDGE
jgi:hypothetical protein